MRTLPGALPRECFIHFLLFLCNVFDIINEGPHFPAEGERDERKENVPQSAGFYVQAEKDDQKRIAGALL